MKAYTDLEQSRKLAEILPIESADMYYPWYIEDDGDTIESGHRITTPYIGNFVEHRINKMVLPCWSLAALLSVLPRFIKFKGDKYYLGFMKEYVEYANDEISITGRCLHTTGNDNLVDACYEMILKLHELKML